MTKCINNYKFPESDYNRPWGGWETTGVGFLPESEGGLAYCDKTILINGGKSLSIQMHYFREEFWTVQKGNLTIYVGKTADDMTPYNLEAGEKIHIPCGYWHRVENQGKEPSTMLERQIGVCLNEKDIVRIPTPSDPRPYDEEAVEKLKETVTALGLDKNWPPETIKSIYPSKEKEHCYAAAKVAPPAKKAGCGFLGKLALSAILIGYIV